MQGKAGISLLFAAGSRPTASDIAALLEVPVSGGQMARISHRPQDDHGWLELLASGLTFDLRGLAPGAAAHLPIASHAYGLSEDPGSAELEAIALLPGPHIASGGALMPVVRTLMRLGAGLAMELPVTAVCWNPAGAWMDPKYFTRIMFSWLSGGPFPALGLTALMPGKDGGVQSAGLEFFIGQELHIDRRGSEAGPDTLKIAGRIIDSLVSRGPLQKAETFTGADGELLLAEPSADGRRVMVTRSA